MGLRLASLWPRPEASRESHEVWLRIDDFVQLFDTIYECRLAAGPCRAVTTAL